MADDFIRTAAPTAAAMPDLPRTWVSGETWRVYAGAQGAFCGREPVSSGCGTLLAWWVGILCVAVVGTSLFFMYAWVTVRPVDRYGAAMKWLAVPFVVNCVWRTLFPSLYLQRFAFFDSPLNAILVDRGFAFVGETTWVSQAALALTHVDTECSASGRGRPLVQLSGALAVVIYLIAEGMSFYNVATENEWWAAAEVFTDGLGFLVMAPSAVYLAATQDLGGKGSSAQIFCAIFGVFCVVYPFYNFAVDVPMYMSRYHADQRAGKKYLPFLTGLGDAATRRVVTHRLADWDQDLPWMTMYFTVGCWACILLMWAPRVKRAAVRGVAAKLREIELQTKC